MIDTLLYLSDKLV